MSQSIFLQKNAQPNTKKSTVASNLRPSYWDQGKMIGKKYTPIQSSKDICLYFPDLQVVIYRTVSKQELEIKIIQNLVRQVIKEKIQRNDLLDCNLIFKSLGKGELIASNSSIIFKLCQRVIVLFQSSTNFTNEADKTILSIRVNPHLKYEIGLESNSKFRLKQLYIKYNLNKWLFNALMIGKQIVSNYQTLQKIKLPYGRHPAYPLFSFQIFYHHMQTIYKSLNQKNFNFQPLIFTLFNENERKTIENIPFSPKIDKLTCFIIIYLMRQQFQQKKQHKKIVDFMNGKIKIFEEDPQIQIMSLMVNSIHNLATTDCEPIFIIEEIQQQNLRQNLQQEHIVRIQTFCRASNNLEKLKKKASSNYQIYKVQHLSAKNISNYSGKQLEYTHLILPFTEYYIQSKNRINSKITYSLVQLPTPKQIDSNLILYICSKMNTISISDYKQLNCELIQVKNHKILQICLKKYYCLISSRNVCVIYNNQDLRQVIDTVNLIHEIIGSETRIMICIQDRLQVERRLKGEDNKSLNQIKITENLKEIKPFIHFCFQNQEFKQERNNCQCVIN